MPLKKHDWSFVASEEPYFGVLANEQYRNENITDEHLDAFYESGKADIERLRNLFQANFNQMPSGKALDFGCGVGRHTLAIAEHATDVTGYDISPEMLTLARQRVTFTDIKNANFANQLPDGPFDWINSYIVFQHIMPSEGMGLLRKILARTSDQAMISIYFPIWSEASARPSRNPISIINTAAIRFLSRLNKLPAENLIQMHTYDISKIIKVANQSGFKDIFLKYENHCGFHGAWVISKKTI